MTAIDPGFGRKARDAAPIADAYRPAMIRSVMNGRDWAILGALAADLGRRILPHRRCRAPRSAIHLCPAAADDCRCGDVGDAGMAARDACPAARGVGRDRAPCFAQQCPAVHSVRLGPDAHCQRPRLDPQRDDADLGRDRRASVHRRRAHHAAQARWRRRRVCRSGGDDRPGLAQQPWRRRRWPSWPASWPRLPMRWPVFGHGGSRRWACPRSASRPAS